MAMESIRLPLETVFAKEDKNRFGLSWKSPRLSHGGQTRFAVRTKWQSGPGSGNGPAEAIIGNCLFGNGRWLSWKTNPT